MKPSESHNEIWAPPSVFPVGEGGLIAPIPHDRGRQPSEVALGPAILGSRRTLKL